jgi:hypothetical protein
MKFDVAEPLPPSPDQKDLTRSVGRMIDNITDLLTERYLLESNPEQEEALGRAMMEGLEKELDEKDAERRKIWGDRYPPKLYQKPPKGYIPPPPPVNRVNGVVEGGGMAEVGRGVRGEGEEKGKSVSTKDPGKIHKRARTSPHK